MLQVHLVRVQSVHEVEGIAAAEAQKGKKHRMTVEHYPDNLSLLFFQVG